MKERTIPQARIPAGDAGECAKEDARTVRRSQGDRRETGEVGRVNAELGGVCRGREAVHLLAHSGMDASTLRRRCKALSPQGACGYHLIVTVEAGGSFGEA